MLLDVERLNVDAASFRQLRQTAGDDPVRVSFDNRAHRR